MSTHGQRELQKTCLDEIDACRDGPQRLPWFIALRGDRYGYVQTDYLPTSEFQNPGNFAWLELLRESKKYVSITSMEIMHAVASVGKDLRVDQLHAFCYFRERGFLDKVPADMRWVFDFEFRKLEGETS